jgi:hypothetical protein
MNINETIFELFDHIDENSLESDAKLSKELDYVNNIWDNLPEEKIEDTDRTLLAMSMMDLSLKVKNYDLAKKWTDIYLYKEKNQEISDLYNGQLAFYQQKYDVAYHLLKNAFDLTNGRIFSERKDLLDIIVNPDRYIKS